MTTPEPANAPRPHPSSANAWREIVQSGADCSHIEGFALEHLIDLQRDRLNRPEEGR